MCYENSFPTVYYNYRNYTNLAPLKIQQKRVKLFIRTISDDLHLIQEDGTIKSKRHDSEKEDNGKNNDK